MNTRDIIREVRTFRQLAGRGNYSPDQSIISAIDNRQFPISDNLFFGFCPQHNADKEWQRCLRLFENRLLPNMPNLTPENFFNPLMMEWMRANQELQRLEAPIKDELLALSQDVVREIYGIEPEDVEFNPDILPPGNNGFDSRNSEEIPDFKRDMPDMGSEAPEMGSEAPIEDQVQEDPDAPISPEREAYVREEAQKRLIMNGFAHGSAIHIWKSSYYIAQERLNALNPQLIEWYDKYAALVSFLMWMFPAEQMRQMIESNQAVNQGWNKVGFKQKDCNEDCNEDERPEDNEDEEVPVVTGVGMNFPVLLHELSKGVVELISYHAIPTDFSVKELQLYYQISDDYVLEPWFYFLAPTLWSDMVTVVNKINEEFKSDNTDLNDEVEIPETLEFLCSLPYEELAEMCVYIVHDKDKAVSAIQEYMEELQASEDEEEDVYEPESVIPEILPTGTDIGGGDFSHEEDLSSKDFDTLTVDELATLQEQAIADEDYSLAGKCKNRIEEIKKTK